MNLTIKNIPDHVHKLLKQEAGRHGRSLNAEAIEALAKAAEQAERRRKMSESWNDLERFVGKQTKAASSVPLIRADRDRH